MYDLALRFFHVVGMLIWITSAVGVFVVRLDSQKIRTLIDKIQMPLAFFVPLTGCLLLIERPHLFSEVWMIGKLVLSIIASGCAISSRLVLMADGPGDIKVFYRYQGLEIILLLSVLAAVFFHA